MAQSPAPPATPLPVSSGREVYLFFALAFAITWLLDTPYVLACLSHTPPPPYTLALTGLGAFGPMLAAIAIAAWRGGVREVFGRWRTNPLWILVALALPYALHIPANLIEVALGGHPAKWFYPPVEPERMAALVMFPIGEEFGWRGFAHSRVTRLHGLVGGSLILGACWGLWHLGMMFTPEKSPDLLSVGGTMATMAAGSVVWAWFFERGNRSMAVAIALHVGAHLDNVDRAPDTEVRLRVLRFLVLAVAAVFAARALLAKRGAGETPVESKSAA